MLTQVYLLAGIEPALIFYTDGQSTVQDGGSILHQLGVIVYAVGVGNNVKYEQLNKIATNQSYVFLVSSYAWLVGQVYEDKKSKTCSAKYLHLIE